ncbi:MAG: hypothetical protein QOD61_539 [Solirubrobacteraceae bacterium]|nr:hypothetical protein [Solirubrobacteraceae bacterium]
MLAFWVSIAGLSLAQGGIVLLPAPAPYPCLGRLRSRWWALVPAASVGGVVAGISAAGEAAQALTYTALVGVPVLAALALGRAARGAAPVRAVAVVPLFALAWAAPASLAGEAAGLVLAGLSCVALGGFLAAVAPPRWLAGGIIAMAVLDAVLVAGDLLQAPNRVLDAAAPAAGLPQLQRVVLGSAQMGYGDLFVAAALGALLASAPPLQRRAGLLAASFALAFDLLFLLVPELPATVPIAAALIAVELGVRRAADPAGASPPRPRAVAPGLSAGSRGRAGP